MDSNEFLGTGMKFPPQINKSTGRFELSSGNQSVKESVYIILMTQKSERWIRPSFGSEIMSYTFTDVGATMLNIMQRDIADDIRKNEPRISDIEINMDATSRPGYLLIDIDYTVTATNTRDNLVFPFYLDNGDEEETEEGYEAAEEV